MTTGQSVATSDPLWLGRLAQRLEEMPATGPVIFVADSGGGSRAALFTALALGGMQRQPMIDADGRRTDHSWANHVVLVGIHTDLVSPEVSPVSVSSTTVSTKHQ